MIWKFLITTALGADCAAPPWYRSEALKLASKQDELVGFGKNKDVEAAIREARRDIGAQLAKSASSRILGAPRVKDAVNFKAYASDEVLAALPAAIAVDLVSLRRVHGDTVCGTRYVALEISRTKAFEDLNSAEFPVHLGMALTGRIETAEKAWADTPAAAVLVPKHGKADLAGVEMTIARLRTSAEALDKEALAESQLREPLLARADKLAAAVQRARAIEWEEARAPVIAEARALARKYEVYLVAVTELRAKNFLAAFETFQALARDGDAGAQFQTGLLYFEGQGVRKSLKESFDWFKRAAAQNHGPAKMMIGLFYFSGYGVKVNHAEAYKWFSSAAQEGWACEAQFNACKRTAITVTK